MFQVEVSNSEGGIYPLRSYLSLVTGLDMSAKYGHAQAYGQYADLAGQFQDFSSSSIGFNMRQELFGTMEGEFPDKKMNYFDHGVPVFCKLVTDFSACSLPLLPEVAIRLEIVLNEPSFYILCRDKNVDEMKYRLTIQSANLLLPVKSMAASLALDMEKRLASTPVTYPQRGLWHLPLGPHCLWQGHCQFCGTSTCQKWESEA